MTKRWLIDTDVIIDYLRDSLPASKFLEKAILNSHCFISVITIAELYAGVREGKERQLLENFIKTFEPIAVSAEIAREGGLYRRDYGKSHGVRLADAIIAASANAYDAILVTLNKKHFPMLKTAFVPYTK